MRTAWRDADATGFEVGERDAIALAFRSKSGRRRPCTPRHDLAGVGRFLPQFFSIDATR